MPLYRNIYLTKKELPQILYLCGKWRWKMVSEKKDLNPSSLHYNPQRKYCECTVW